MKTRLFLLALMLLSLRGWSAEAPVPTTSTLLAIDKAEFDKIISPNAKLVKIAGDGALKFTEGPVWVQDGGYLLFSDIPADTIYKYQDGKLTVARQPSQGINGNQLDAQGRLVSCAHGARALLRGPIAGPVEVLADAYEGKKLNSPNDLAIRADGLIYFTDPPFGLANRPRELDRNYVFRFNPATKKLDVITGEITRPNGVCLSPDEKKLYIANAAPTAEIFVYEVQPDGQVGAGRVFCKLDSGSPDGMRCDPAGRLFTSAGDGVHVFSPEGKLLGKILIQPKPTNLCFGGPDGKTLFITARTEVYSIPLR